MMSSAHAESTSASVRSSIGLTSLLLLSAFGGILLAPSASAAISGDYEITASLSPIPGNVMTAWDPITLEVQITNSGFFYNTDSRSIEWFICEGTKVASSCFDSREDYGTGIIESITVGQSVNYTFGQTFGSDGNEGPYTLVYRFIDSDTNTSNDFGLYNFNLSQQLVDVSFESQDIISQLDGLAQYDGDLILNTDTDYNMSLDGIVTSCGTCNLEANIGWSLINSVGNEVASQTTTYSNLPSWGQSGFTRDLPPLNFGYEGEYTLHYGLIGSNGTPSGDMNSYNDLQSIDVIFDDTVDLKIDSMFPLNSPGSEQYYYGNDSVSVTISNIGNHTVVEPLVKFTIMSLDDNPEYEEECYPLEIRPGSEEICIFSLNKLGDKKLKVYVTEVPNEGTDVSPSDNIVTSTVEVVAGDINPIIEQSNFYGKYKTADNVTFSARTLSTAPGPLTYSWWSAGIIPLGTGKELQLSASSIGLGDHYISVRVTDSLGDMESTVTSITVYNSTDIRNGNWINGSAITRTHAMADSNYDYPLTGLAYNTGEELEALLRISIDVSPTDGQIDAGMDWMEFDLNLTAIIPDNIPRDKLVVHRLNGFDQKDWDPLEGQNSFELIDNQTMRVHIIENMDLLIVGELAPPEVNSGDLELVLLPDGKMQIDWTPTGDLSNPYFGGWNIYRVTSPISASAYFPDPSTTSSEFLWRGLMQNSLSATLEGESNTWTDNRELETGICTSYAIIPIDRSGEPNYLEAKVSKVDGNPGLTCGDAIDPTSVVIGMTATTSYNNNTSCYEMFLDWNRCYEVTLSWTWPNHEPEGNITWNLYRIEQKPQDVDLRFIEPILMGISNVPGEENVFTQLGTDYDGILPYRTYYYVLAPLDHIGNEYTIANYPSSNVERVYVQEEYWDYNEYRIPEPPEPEEPPYGVEWLGDLQEYMEIENFQIAGMVMLLTVLVNFIGLPLILKKRKRMKRVLAKRAGKQTVDSDDDFEDFFN